MKWGKRMGEVFDDLVHRPELTGVVFDKPEDTDSELKNLEGHWESLRSHATVSRDQATRSLSSMLMQLG